MRLVVVAIAVAVASLAGRGLAQGTPATTTPVTAVDAEESLGGGQAVSRPLTPVEIPPEATTAVEPPDDGQPNAEDRIKDAQDQKYSRRGPLGPGWDDFEFLLWWPKSQGLPPLVTASRSGASPILGNSGTALLVGGHSMDNQDIGGGRFTLGASINDEETIGVEGVYFFLGSRTLKETIRSQNNPGAEALGIPFVNSSTGKKDVFLIAGPGVSTGSVFVSNTTRLQGAEGNIVANLYDGIDIKINGILGYRFIQVNEGIALADQRTVLGGAGTYGPIYDEFDGHNQFNGGQLGLHTEITHGMVFCELTGKVAIGVNSQLIKIDGETTINTPVLGGVNSQTYPGGVLALPSNSGYFTHNGFAVAPEGTFRVGLKLGDMSRVFVGYNFLYLSDVVRPGDQIDRTLNPIQIPSLYSGSSFSGADRPRVPFVRSDFWTQGLLIGLETRY